jgi:sugar lactone lactonase YvrE
MASDKFVPKDILKASWGDKNGELGLGGTGPEGLMSPPNDFLVDNDSNVYVNDSVNQRIAKFDKNGNFIMNFGITYLGAEMPPYYSNMEVDGSNNIYAYDHKNGNILKYGNNGKTLDIIPGPGKDKPAQIRTTYNGDLYIRGLSYQKKYTKTKAAPGAKEVYTPKDEDYIYESPKGNLYQFNKGRGKSKFEKIGQGGIKLSASGRKNISDVFDPTAKGHKFIGFDVDDNMYILEHGQKTMNKYDPNGKLIMKINLPEEARNSYGSRVRIDYYGNIYKMLFDNNGVKIVKMEKVK